MITLRETEERDVCSLGLTVVTNERAGHSTARRVMQQAHSPNDAVEGLILLHNTPVGTGTFRVRGFGYKF